MEAVLEDMARLIAKHHRSFGADPRALYLAPRVYRAWRDTLGEFERIHGTMPASARDDGDYFMGIRVACSERMPHGFDMFTRKP